MTHPSQSRARYEVGDEIQSQTSLGVALTLARVTSRGFAQCTHCPVSIQRTSKGDLADGVRAHYKTVHPDRSLR